MTDRFRDPFLAEKYAEFRGFALTASLFAPPFAGAMWAWEWGVDPAHAMDTLDVRLLMMLLGALIPLCVKLYAKTDAGAWIALVLTVVIEALLCVVHHRIDQGAVLGMPGFLFFFLLAPLISFMFSLRVNIALNLLLALTPLALYLGTGVPLGFHVAAYVNAMLPAAGFVIFGLILLDRALRRFFETKRAAAWRSAAIDQLTVPVFVTDSKSLLEYANQTALSLLGQRGAALIGEPLHSLLELPASRQRQQTFDARVRRAGEGAAPLLLLSATQIERPGNPPYTVYVGQDISAARAESDALRDAAMTDPVTSLANRRAFDQALAVRLQQESELAVLFLDLDGFKAINDQYGHETGDALLRVLAQRLGHAMRSHDLVARLGGDEFTLLAALHSGEDEARALAERVLRVLSEPVHLGPLKVQVGASIGVALSQGKHRDARILLRAADAAMYRAKGDGKGRVELARSGEYA